MLRYLLLFYVLLGLTTQSAAMDADSIKKFHDAVQIGDVETVKAMLSAEPAFATSTDEHKFQPIHLLDMYFDPEILKLLLSNGADINAKNDDGITLLHIIADPEAVSVIVANGGDIEARDTNGRTPLIEQADNQQNGTDVVVALLASGANANAKDFDDQTALSLAQQTSNQDLARVLRRAGAEE